MNFILNFGKMNFFWDFLILEKTPIF